MTYPMLEIRDISKQFVKRLDLAAKIAAKLGANVKEEVVHAVDGVSMSIAKGEVLGLVGESGCGKTTLGRIVAGILEPTAGEIHFKGKAVSSKTGGDAKDAALQIQMIFQDPFASLNPRMRVVDIIGEAPVCHGIVSAADRAKYVEDVMLQVGLDPEFARRFPHQFSGGQRQRIGIKHRLSAVFMPALAQCAGNHERQDQGCGNYEHMRHDVTRPPTG